MKVLDRAKDRTELAGSPYGNEASLAGQWRAAFAVLVFGLIGLVILFWETAASAVHTWYSSDSYNHSFLVIPICIYLIWRRREVFRRLAPLPSLWGIAAAALMALVWKLGELSAILVVQQLALVAMAQALFLAIMGPRVVRALAFPLFYLYFAVPFGSFLIAPLQEVTALIVVRLLQVSGIPVYLDGFLIQIPAGNFHIAEACAGARFLLTSLAIGFLAAQLFYSHWNRRVLFVALSIMIPILANGLRAYGIVAIAHLGSFELAGEVDHVTFGLVFLGVVMAILLALGLTFREQAPAPAYGNASIEAGGQAALERPYASYALMGLAGFLAIAGIATLGSDEPPHATTGGRPELSIPTVSIPWTALDNGARDWRPSFAGADVEMIRSYTDGGQIVDFYLAYYSHQRQGAEIINQQNSLAGTGTWSLSEGGGVEAVLDNQPLELGSARLVSAKAGRIVWYWYWVDGTFTASPIIAKLRQVKAGLLGNSEAAAAIAISTTVSGTPAQSAATLHSFLDHLESLSRFLERLTALTTAARSTSTQAGRVDPLRD
ncbi:MAG: exosortase A [Planctomycetes bacterium]|nr:exosortase A [Planctomycetota bacterium]